MGRKAPNPPPPNIPNKPTPPPPPPRLTEGKMRTNIKQMVSNRGAPGVKPKPISRPKGVDNKMSDPVIWYYIMMYGINEPEKEKPWIKHLKEVNRNNLWQYTEYETGPFVCPVCKGKGVVDKDFYPDPESNALYTKCRTCKGEGIVWKK